MSSEQVLVTNREDYLKGPNDFLTSFEVSDKMYFVDRDLAETDESKLQVIPYCMIYSPYRILVSTRTKKGNEERLYNKKSIGIGGHINPSDIEDGSFIKGIFREIGEETGLTNLSENQLLFSHPILMDKTPVSRVHIGIGLACIVDDEELDKIQAKDGELILEAKTWQEVREGLQNDPSYEEWSKSFLLWFDYQDELDKLIKKSQELLGKIFGDDYDRHNPDNDNAD